MPCYYFDIHVESLSEWDDDGIEAADIERAIAHAAEMMPAALMGRDCLAVIVVRDQIGHQIATLTGNKLGELRVTRPDGSTSA
jgi:hypothetical protein